MAKTTITIRKHGDKVFFLTGKGFQKGFVKTTYVSSTQHRDLDISYRVVADDDLQEFGGYEKNPSELFDSKKEMISFYQNSL